jgi:cyanate lyase
MKRVELTEKLLDIKREKKLDLAAHHRRNRRDVTGFLIVGAVLGQMRLPKALAERARTLFGLSQVEQSLLSEVPSRGSPMPPSDPLLYRFCELLMVNGPAWKALIEEEFGDGIMSAIDFDMTLERLPNPKGDRVQITMSGKFLPFKYYGTQRACLRTA